VPSGTLPVVAHASFAQHSLTPLLKQNLAAFAHGRLALTLLHRPVDLIEEGFNAGIVAPRQVSGGTLIRRPLVAIAQVAVASPNYLDRHRAPTRHADLARHTLLAPSTDIHGNEWHFASPGGVHEPVQIKPAYAVNNLAMLPQAALTGMGITILPASRVAADLAQGALVHVLDCYEIRDADNALSLVYLGRRHVPAKTRSLVDCTVEWFRRLESPRQAIIDTSCNS
jgi:DNA-binding transcriptional LysR family regulator